jgi:hypothetical protein
MQSASVEELRRCAKNDKACAAALGNSPTVHHTAFSLQPLSVYQMRVERRSAAVRNVTQLLDIICVTESASRLLGTRARHFVNLVGWGHYRESGGEIEYPILVPFA